MSDQINGLVTLADIIGWKGIWQRQDSSVIDDIITVRNEVIEFAERKSKFHIYNAMRATYPELAKLDFNRIKPGSKIVDNAIKKLSFREDDKISNEKLKL
ncbi:MAG: hypothetical protein WCX83_03685 [Candidatus Cloacimonas sp.]